MKVSVVTGASRGMGRACVDRLRRDGTCVVALDLEAPDIEGTIGVACDVSDRTGVSGLVDEVSRLGTFQALVHAAGISPTMADPRRILEVDLVGTHLLLEAFEPLVEEGCAAVCFASSAAYHVTLAGADSELDTLVEDPSGDAFLDRAAPRFSDSGMAYAWAKRGVIRAAARAAVSWGVRGGRVNSVSPGLIDTGMGRQEFEAQPVMQLMLENTPLHRLGRPEEVAALVAFLVSGEASFVSGVDVLIDGGGYEGLRALASRST